MCLFIPRMSFMPYLLCEHRNQKVSAYSSLPFFACLHIKHRTHSSSLHTKISLYANKQPCQFNVSHHYLPMFLFHYKLTSCVLIPTVRKYIYCRLLLVHSSHETKQNNIKCSKNSYVVASLKRQTSQDDC